MGIAVAFGAIDFFVQLASRKEQTFLNRVFELAGVAATGGGVGLMLDFVIYSCEMGMGAVC